MVGVVRVACETPPPLFQEPRYKSGEWEIPVKNEVQEKGEVYTEDHGSVDKPTATHLGSQSTAPLSQIGEHEGRPFVQQGVQLNLK
jgi:hypothetical protein